MNWERWAAFAAAALVVGLIPGPGVTSIIGYAISSGRRTALTSVAGMAIGNVIAMSVSLAGAGALLAASATAFTVLKLAGAAYLISLGVIAILRSRRDAAASAAGTAVVSPRTALLGNVAIGAFHPKTIIFFVAFAPQFISPDASYAGQAAILVATWAVVVGVTDTLYALTASYAAQALRTLRAMLWSKRAGGGFLIAAGLATAAARK